MTRSLSPPISKGSGRPLQVAACASSMMRAFARAPITASPVTAIDQASQFKRTLAVVGQEYQIFHPQSLLERAKLSIFVPAFAHTLHALPASRKMRGCPTAAGSNGTVRRSSFRSSK